MVGADLQSALDAAVAEGLGPNVRRWLHFVGAKQGDWIEVQAVEVPDRGGKWTSTRFAHAGDAETLIKLLAEADTWGAPGIYYVANRIDPAVATRKLAGSWHVAPKGESTTDRDIRARNVLYVDIDVERPKGTSATDAQVALAHATAVRIYEDIAAQIGEDALAFGHSGNGRALFVALNHPKETPEMRAIASGVLAALRAVYQGGGVKIDIVVAEAKRLVPAFGTMKRKGAPGIAQYPHRRTAIVGPERVKRISVQDLEALLAGLRGRLDEVQNLEIDKAMGKRPTPAAKPSSSRRDGPNPFDEAKQVPIGDVLSWLGLEGPVCPGCGLTGDSSVAIVGNGLKCSHERCARHGVPGEPGFRTPIDVVMETRGVDAREAVNLMAEHFGFDGVRERSEAKRAEPVATKTKEKKKAPTPKVTEPIPDGARMIDIGPDLHRVANQAAAALAEDTEGDTYQRDGYLVHIVRATEIEAARDASVVPDTPTIRRMAAPTLRLRLCKVAVWRKLDARAGRMVRTVPPDAVVAGTLNEGAWDGVRPIVGIIEAPSLRPDGSLVAEAGYDNRTGFLFAPNEAF